MTDVIDFVTDVNDLLESWHTLTEFHKLRNVLNMIQWHMIEIDKEAMIICGRVIEIGSSNNMFATSKIPFSIISNVLKVCAEAKCYTMDEMDIYMRVNTWPGTKYLDELEIELQKLNKFVPEIDNDPNKSLEEAKKSIRAIATFSDDIMSLNAICTLDHKKYGPAKDLVDEAISSIEIVADLDVISEQLVKAYTFCLDKCGTYTGTYYSPK